MVDRALQRLNGQTFSPTQKNQHKGYITDTRVLTPFKCIVQVAITQPALPLALFGSLREPLNFAGIVVSSRTV